MFLLSFLGPFWHPNISHVLPQFQGCHDYVIVGCGGHWLVLCFGFLMALSYTLMFLCFFDCVLYVYSPRKNHDPLTHPAAVNCACQSKPQPKSATHKPQPPAIVGSSHPAATIRRNHAAAISSTCDVVDGRSWSIASINKDRLNSPTAMGSMLVMRFWNLMQPGGR